MSAHAGGRFRLEGILRLAASREEQMAQHVARLEATRRSEEERMGALQQSQAAAVQDARAVYLEERLDVAGLLQTGRYADALQEHVRAQAERIVESTARLEDGRSTLVAASQRRRMLEKLKEQHGKRWRAHLERLDTAQAAELGATQYLRRRGEEQDGHGVRQP